MEADFERIGQIQKINQQILDEVDRICRKYGICYYLDSGTLLGAIRHKGAIPWDDDMDISFMRKEFVKFERAVEKEWLDGKFLLHKPTDFAHGKWMDWVNRIVWMEKDAPHIQYPDVGVTAAGAVYQKAQIDVFIIDPIPDKKLLQGILFLNLFIDYGLAMGHRAFFDYGHYTILQRVVIWTLSNIGKRISMEKIFSRYSRDVTKYSNTDTTYCFIGNYSWKAFRIVYKKKWFGNGSMVEFDGKEYLAPANPHAILKKTYGDYMKLPPERERTPQHMSGKFVKYKL